MSDPYWQNIAQRAERTRAKQAKASASLNTKWRPKKRRKLRRRRA